MMMEINKAAGPQTSSLPGTTSIIAPPPTGVVVAAASAAHTRSSSGSERSPVGGGLGSSGGGGGGVDSQHLMINPDSEGFDQDQMLDDCNVFVKYLPPDLSDSEFYNLFKSYGPIISSKIMVDQGTGKSLGYGFVRYANSNASLRAIHSMNGQRVANKRLLCKLANLSPSSFTSEFAKHPLLNYQAPSDNIYIKPLLQETSEDDLRKLFGKYGKIVDCKVMVDRNTGLSLKLDL